MKVNKFENIAEDNKTIDKEYPYILTNSGELIRQEKVERYSNIKYIYLSDAQYAKLEKGSKNLKELCDALDEEKRLRVLQFKHAIEKVQKDEK